MIFIRQDSEFPAVGRAEVPEYAHHPLAMGGGCESKMDGDRFHRADIIARFGSLKRRFQNSEESLA